MPFPPVCEAQPTSERRVKRTNAEGMTARQLGHIQAGDPRQTDRYYPPSPRRREHHAERVYDSYGGPVGVPDVLNPLKGRDAAHYHCKTGSSSRRSAKSVEEYNPFGMFAGDPSDDDDLSGPRPEWTKRHSGGRKLDPRPKGKWDFSSESGDEDLPRIQTVKSGQPGLVRPGASVRSARQPQRAELMGIAPDGTAYSVPRRSATQRVGERGLTAEEARRVEEENREGNRFRDYWRRAGEDRGREQAARRARDGREAQESARQVRERMEVQYLEKSKLEQGYVLPRGVREQWSEEGRLADEILRQRFQQEPRRRGPREVQPVPTRPEPMVSYGGSRSREYSSQGRSARVTNLEREAEKMSRGDMRHSRQSTGMPGHAAVDIEPSSQWDVTARNGTYKRWRDDVDRHHS
ncbi:hypothetical protein ACHAQA_002512 [Verticillium albo-atrum]